MTIEALLRESNLIENFDLAEADALAVKAWKSLRDVKLYDLTNEHIETVQKILTEHQDDLKPEWRGKYRNVSNQRVWVGDREGVTPIAVPNMMNDWLHLLPESDPLRHHVQFEIIHPFVDGNGRVGRILLWWTEQAMGLPYTEITLSARQNYYQWFMTDDLSKDNLRRLLAGSTM